MLHTLRVPELGLTELALSLWLVKTGQRVSAGDRVVELLADGVTIDLTAPISGQLVRRLVEEESPLGTGDALALIVPESDEPR